MTDPKPLDAGVPDAGELRERLSLLRDSAAQYAGQDVHLKRSRALRSEQPGYDRAVWAELAGLGWLGTLIPESHGGLGLGCADMAVLCEAMGRTLFPEPVTASVVLAGGAILHGDNAALKQALLPALVGGKLVPALAWRENVQDCEPLQVEMRAEAGAGGLRLSGTKVLVVGGIGADGYVVSARAGDELLLCWVRAGAAGSRIPAEQLPDGRPVATLILEGVQVPAADILARGEVAAGALMRAYDEALIMTSAELLGLSTRVLEITVDYLKTRVQFGRAIGSFQALQHQAANLYIQQRLCRHALDEAVMALQDPAIAADERGAWASRVKARCSDASLKITRGAVQMHGAMGFADECDVGLYLKRAVTLSAWLGGTVIHRRRYARLALKEVAA
jgi:alkylation response protein AidB-like acyl-CoA dehydrogenase